MKKISFLHFACYGYTCVADLQSINNRRVEVFYMSGWHIKLDSAFTLADKPIGYRLTFL